MRKLLTAFMAFGLMYGCAYAEELKPELKAEARPSHAHINAEYKVYNTDRDAMVDVESALAKAKIRGTKALIVMGANWCHDSRGLAARLDTPEFQTLISNNFELVYVSVGINPGQRNENRDVSQRFGVEQIEGTPTVFIVDVDGKVLNADSAGYWRQADSIPTDMSFAYFDMYAKK